MIRQHAGLDVHVRVGGMTRHLIILLLLTAIVSMDPGPLHAADPVPPIELAPGVFYRNLDPAANQSFILFDSYVVVFDPGGPSR
jgi:hypothetical protein